MSSEAPRAPSRRVLLVAGEPSGDGHAAGLVAALRRRMPGVEVFGIGGPAARSAGMRTVIDLAEISTVGLLEVLEKSRALVRAFRWLRRTLRDSRPDLLVLVDFPDFNLLVARVAKRFGVPVFYYVSPQVWAWRPGRVRKILRRVDRLAVIFPFEQAVYGDSPKVTFVGHPLLDRVAATRGREETLVRHGLDPGRPLVALLPGSRPAEIRHMLPLLADVAERLAEARPRLQFAVALAPTLPLELAEPWVRGRRVTLPLIEDDAYNLIVASELAIVTSGTATLETAILERPMVIVYRTSPLTAFVGMRLLRVPFIGMPNLIAGHEIVPEFLQRTATPQRVFRETLAVLDEPARGLQIARDLAEVHRRLGASGADDRAAAIAADLLEARNPA